MLPHNAIYVYFNVNFNVFFKLIKVHLLVSELYIYQNARCKYKKKTKFLMFVKIRRRPSCEREIH